ncbi:MAG: hypothetical protein M3R00_05920 [Pseudomonadota bacterium]|nr:hypothetical protein [Pseudomonadota bacterium]
MNISTEIEHIDKAENVEEAMALLKSFIAKLKQLPELSESDKLFLKENLISGLQNEAKNSANHSEMPASLMNDLLSCLSDLINLTQLVAGAEPLNLPAEIEAICNSYDTKETNILLEGLVERISQLAELTDEQKTSLKKLLITPLVERIKNLDNLPEEQLPGMREMLWSLSNLICLTHTNAEICTYIATQMHLSEKRSAERECETSFPDHCGFFYEILSGPRRAAEGETFEEYWDRYTYLISLHEIGFAPEMLEWRLLTLAEAEAALAQGKETDFLDKKPPTLFDTVKADLIQMMKTDPKACIRAEARLWRLQLMGPLYNTNRLLRILSYADMAAFEGEHTQLAETIIQHLTEIMMCSLTLPDIDNALQALFKIYDGLLDYLQQQEHTQKLALDLGKRLLSLLQNPEWPEKFSIITYEINRDAVTDYVEKYVCALTRRIEDLDYEASSGSSLCL